MPFDVDPKIRPQDDLFRFVNGPWLARTEIPADKSRAGAFMTLRDEAEAAVREIVSDCSGAPGSVEAMIRTLYDDFLDEAAIEAAGIEPLRPVLDRIAAITSPDELFSFFAWALPVGITTPISCYVDADPGDPQTYRLAVDQDGIGLPDEEYYRLDEHAAIREKYQAHIAAMLRLGGFDPELATSVFELERQLASHHWDKVKCRDLAAGYNPTPVGELAPQWQAVLTQLGLSEPFVILGQPSFFAGVLPVIANTELAVWRAYLTWHTLSTFAGVLPKAFVEEDFAFFSKTLAGVQQVKDRWKRGVALVEDVLGEAIGQVYVQRHLSAAAKVRMDELVANLIAAYHQSISSLTWMSEATRAEALAKLAKFRSKIGYPEKWRDYSGLELRVGELVSNLIAASIHLSRQEFAKLGGPIWAWEWLMTPQTVNAYYHPLRNEIVFPAAILQPPFFDEAADDAVNYGAIGAVIGHEIGHGFDDQGSTCDGDGRLRDWWQAADREAFEERTARLVEQYDGLTLPDLPEARVNGELTLGENIGDLGGLAIAYLAWQISLAGAAAPVIDGFTGAQRFFLSWARAWQEKIRPEALAEQLATDPHAPDEFRCNQVVKNLDAFHEAFAVQPGDGMWLDPKDRVSIW